MREVLLRAACSRLQHTHSSAVELSSTSVFCLAPEERHRGRHSGNAQRIGRIAIPGIVDRGG